MNAAEARAQQQKQQQQQQPRKVVVQSTLRTTYEPMIRGSIVLEASGTAAAESALKWRSRRRSSDRPSFSRFAQATIDIADVLETALM